MHRHAETIVGAQNRLKNTLAAQRSCDYEHFIAIENGIFEVPVSGQTKYFDLAWVIVQDKKGRQWMAHSVGIECSAADVEQARTSEGGFKEHTVGSFTGPRLRCPANDWHGAVTANSMPRAQLMKDAVKAAIAQSIASSLA